MSGQASVSSVITKDHRELEEYYNNIVKSNDEDTQTRYQNHFVWELARHSIGEELVVYPALEQYLGADGKALADKDRKEHLAVKEALYKFQSLRPSDADFIPQIESLMKDLSEHIKEEESDDLPALEKALNEKHPNGSASEDLARSFNRTKMFVPTRSHPSAPDKPPFETVAGLMAAPLDLLGDVFRKFPKET
ncbi:MAG: hypothetical protein M1825_005595 [Sarcosagium campestre]|nr:MAG: hypothetical protein M1825_005595 [Sarcosagium campestre]